MRLLQSGVIFNVIALRMCHESNSTVHSTVHRSAAAVPSDAETMHTVSQPQVLGGIEASVQKQSINPHSFVVRIGIAMEIST